jgi:hypothetical protein
MRRLTSTPPTGDSGRPLAQQLGMHPGCRLFPHAAQENYAALLAPRPAGATVVSRLDTQTDIVLVMRKSARPGARSRPRTAKSGLRPKQ